jgi:hypothetical protein
METQEPINVASERTKYRQVMSRYDTPVLLCDRQRWMLKTKGRRKCGLAAGVLVLYDGR